MTERKQELERTSVRQEEEAEPIEEIEVEWEVVREKRRRRDNTLPKRK